MQAYIVEGGNKLEGEVEISGAKNAVLGMIPATLLAADISTIDNVPDIDDVRKFIHILEGIGAQVEFKDNTLVIDSRQVKETDCSTMEDDVSKMRASYYLYGALLGRFHHLKAPLPGGCDIGIRPIDQHLKGFNALGATYKIEDKNLVIDADELKGQEILLDMLSVGATINIMLAAVLADGKTSIQNAAKEPHVVDVANFLNMMGANIRGAGTDEIRIVGVKQLHGANYTVIPDQITTGTYMIAAAATEGDVLVKNVIPQHMETLSRKMREMGIDVIVEDDKIRVKGKRPFKPVMIETAPYPGFPTDLQQPFAVLLSLAEGESKIVETIFKKRFGYINELLNMGMDANVEENICTITGTDTLDSGKVKATDLRAGAAMVIAALVADGESQITNLQYIDRGYENFEENLRNLGANIKRVTIDSEEIEEETETEQD